MQELKPRDMSLPDRVATLERQRLRDKERLKIQSELISEMALYMEVMMTFLDGHVLKGYKFVKHSLPLRAILEKQMEDENSAE